MTSTAKKIVVLADYRKAREELNLTDIQEIASYEGDHLRDLDDRAAQLMQKRHSLKQTELARVELARIDSNLQKISDWVKDEPVETSNQAKANTLEEMKKQSGELLARSEKLRKVLVDDMTSRRYYEGRWLPDPTRVISLLIVAPVSAGTFVREFIKGSKMTDAVHAGEAMLGVGLYFTFKNQVDGIIGAAKDQVVAAVPKVGKDLRSRIVATSLTASVANKSGSEIAAYLPGRYPRQQKTTLML